MTALRRRRRRPAPDIPAHMLTGEYFTALMRRHNFPPMFVSRIDEDAPMPLIGAAAIAHRERQAQTGVGWGTGTTVMPGTPKNKRPTWMVRKRG